MKTSECNAIEAYAPLWYRPPHQSYTPSAVQMFSKGNMDCTFPLKTGLSQRMCYQLWKQSRPSG